VKQIFSVTKSTYLQAGAHNPGYGLLLQGIQVIHGMYTFCCNSPVYNSLMIVVCSPSVSWCGWG